MPVLKKRKEERRQTPAEAGGSGAIAAPDVDPMVRARELAAGVSQLIGAATEMAGARVSFRITPLLSGITISWERRTLPSRQWLRDLEQEIITFGVCNGLQVWFREV